MTDDYLARIGNLIRDARKHRGWTQQQLADVLATSQSAVNRIERGHQNLSLEMLARIGEALDSEIVSLGAGPTHLRVTGPTHAVRLDRREVLEERRRRAALRLAAQPRAYDAAPGRPHRGGQPAARGARPASACRPAGSTTTTTSRSSRRPTSTWTGIDEEAARRTRSIIMFLGPLMHRAGRLRAAVRRRLRPRHPHRRAAHGRAAPVRPRGQGHRGQLPRHASTGRLPDAGRSCSPSAATPSPRTPCWPPPGTTASP